MSKYFAPMMWMLSEASIPTGTMKLFWSSSAGDEEFAQSINCSELAWGRREYGKRADMYQSACGRKMWLGCFRCAWTPVKKKAI